MPPVLRRLAVLAVVGTMLAVPALGAGRGPDGVRFRADATKRGGWWAEWADLTCVSESRVSQVKRPVALGDSRVHGDSIVYVDGTTVAQTRAVVEAEAGAGF